MVDLVSTPYSRVFLVENGSVNGNQAATYEGLWKAGGVTFGQGTVTPNRIPSKTAYGQFTTVNTTPGQQNLPELAITARYSFALSDMLRLVNIGCNHDLQVHFGQCQNPQDFLNGWSKILVLEQARISNYTTNELGALEPGNSAIVDEQVTWQGQTIYEISKLTATEVGGTNVIAEIIAVSICDQAGCGGVCGASSDGCQNIFMVTLAAGVSPGLTSHVVYSANGMSTSGTVPINSMAIASVAADSACVGNNLVVVTDTNSAEAIHYAATVDILNGVAAPFSAVTTGFVSTKGPSAIWSLGPNETWMAGKGGYIYFTTDPTSGATVQDAGVATAQNLNDIHILDSTHGVAVGVSNAVVRTVDGTTWGAITGPAVGVTLNAVWMKSVNTWFIGTAGGALYRTNDAGTTWTLVGFSGSGAGAVDDIYFVNATVGYMSHHTAAPVGRLFRTIDGGKTWYILPENGAMPDNDRINSIKACRVNAVFGGGLAGTSADGFAVKLVA